MNILAIDQGTSATKALVVSPERGVLAEAEVAVHPTAGGPDSVEQDPEELWASVRDAGRAAVAQAGETIGAVGLANQGASEIYEPRLSADAANERLERWRRIAETTTG